MSEIEEAIMRCKTQIVECDRNINNAKVLGVTCRKSYREKNTWELFLKTIQEKIKRDKMRCENCKHRYRSFDDDCFLCDNSHGLCEIVENCNFCSYFESKEECMDKT